MADPVISRPDMPFLRSPPFPGVSPVVASVSRATPGSHTPCDGDAMVAALRANRVGGSFWARAVSAPAGATIVSVRDAASAAGLATRRDGPLFALLPDAGWSATARRALAAAGIASTTGGVDPWRLLEDAGGLEADGDDPRVLIAYLCGCPVRSTGPGRFVGHGLALDEPSAVDRAATLAALVAATVGRDMIYRDPFTGAAAGVAETVVLLGTWRRLIAANRSIAVAAGIALWKRREVARLLWDGSSDRRFARTVPRALRLARAGGGAIAGWPSRIPAELPAAAAAASVPLHRVEDGFVRSVGLGSNLHPPLSIVVDTRGIYYDPTAPSDLEMLLESAVFDEALVARARALSAAIVRAGISKYSSGTAVFHAAVPAGRQVVLVAGQVEDDLSVRAGGGDVAGNLDLLRRARAAEPDAWLLFKPHPDVDAGHRAGRVDDAVALTLADRVVRDVPMPALLDAVDGVHVLTSLTGYEALLRGRAVTVHGRPFYAGWGLTRDLGPPTPRRTRRLNVDELTAAALILYPRYLDPETGLPCPPEVLIARLAVQVAPRETVLIRLRRLQGWLRRPRGPMEKTS